MATRAWISYLASALSLVAALAHLWATPEHFEEWWGYGTFFLVAAIAQGIYGLALLRWPGRTLFLLGVGGNLGIVVLYVATRTIGIPFFGPHAWQVEEMGVIDVTATVMELALVVALAALWRSQRRVPDGIASVEDTTRVNEPGQGVSRRDFLWTAGVAGALGISGGALGLRAAGGVGALGLAGGALGAHASRASAQEKGAGGHGGGAGQHGGVGDVDLSRFDPSKFLRDFDWGEERQEGGKTVREYELVAQDV